MSPQPQLLCLLFILLIFKVDGAGELKQKISLTKAEEKLAIIDCHFTSDCWSYIHCIYVELMQM
ncbi:unnamed protein product [Leuciscus chuanchicus]